MDHKAVNIFCLQLKDNYPANVLEKWLEYLPDYMQQDYSGYRKASDQHKYLFGRLLLLYGLTQYGGYDLNILNTLKYNAYGRPYIESDIDFNISHSGDIILCALSKNSRVGVDVEKVELLDIIDFEPILSDWEQQEIRLSDHSLNRLYEIWTIKESLVKAIRRGLSIPLNEISSQQNPVIYENKKWYFSKLLLGNGYMSHLTTDMPVAELSFINVSDSRILSSFSYFCNK